MDFSYGEEQQAILELASQILRDGTSQERLREIERADGPRFDPELWSRLADAGLVGLGVPEAHGGGGLGLLELAGVVEQVGRTAAPVPFFESAILGALAIAEFGSEAQRSAILPPVATGERILTAAILEAEAPIESPSTRATREGSDHRLDGTKAFVPSGQLAHTILVSAMTEDGPAVFLVERDAPGLSVEPLETTSGMPEAMLVLDGVRLPGEARLGGAEVIEFIDLRANAALCSLALGVCEAALELTAEYSKTRKQFDQPIAMFQSVSHREADAYIDTQAVRLSALEVAWRISAGRDAAAEVAIAKHFASEAGYRVTFSAQHIHGGIGVDREYPVHRYYVYARHLELMLGGSTHHLRRLGRLIAAGAA